MTGSFAHLRKESPFYPIFPSGAVPILNILVPSRAECEGDGVQDVYMVDLHNLTPEQFDAVTRMVQQQCDPTTPLATVQAEILSRGLPLRAKHVASTSTDSRAFL